MAVTPQNLREFATQSYTLTKQVLAEKERVYLCRHAIDRSKTATMKSDMQVPGTPAAHADPQMESLLERLVPVIEQISQRKVFPTYSYFRVYKEGDALQKHTDRPACEVSVSVNLGYEAPNPWPIWIEGPLGTSSIAMQPGDAVIYRGIDCPHWREPFQGDFTAQVFLHYVDQKGPHAEWKFDKRRRLGTIPVNSIRIADHVQPIQFNGILQFGSGRTAKFDPLMTLFMKDLESQNRVPAIIQHAVKEFKLSQFAAESAVLKFLSILEERGIALVSENS